MLALYEYYYDEIYKPNEFEISGDAKRKIETYQYKILRSLSKEIEDKVSLNERAAFEQRVIRMKNNPEEISRLAGDGMKRVLRVEEILSSSAPENVSFDSSAGTTSNIQNVSKNKLREFKEALDEGLITQEEYEKAKREFLGAVK